MTLVVTIVLAFVFTTHFSNAQKLLITLIFAYIFMLVPLLLGFIAANGFEKLKRS